MSTPEDKVTAEVAKVTAFYQKWELYVGMVVGAIIYGIVKHFL